MSKRQHQLVALDKPVDLPSEAELRDALESLEDATRVALQLRWRIAQVTEELGDSVPVARATPTLAEIGALFIFGHDARARLDEARGYVDDLVVSLPLLDELRETRKSPLEDQGRA